MLFEATKLNGLSLPNRFIRSATWSGLATRQGEATPELITLLTDLALGGVGLIVTGHAFVREDGQAGPWQLGAYKDELIPALETLTRAVHDSHGRIVMQLAHAGVFANTELTGRPPIGPSGRQTQSEVAVREMSGPDIQDVVKAFGSAAARAKRAGFDGVQIHSAHGYLLSQFLAPVFNQRTDAYGGAIENRARVLIESVQAVRKEVGENYPVLVKLNGQDFTENGLTLEESMQVGTMLAAAGVDAIELSGGLPTSRRQGPVRMGVDSEDKEGYFRNEARSFKERITVPVALVGGIRSYHLAERLVAEGTADYISMSRPFIREPALLQRWKSGDHGRASCVSDNKCFRPALAGEGIYCVRERKEAEK